MNLKLVCLLGLGVLSIIAMGTVGLLIGHSVHVSDGAVNHFNDSGKDAWVKTVKACGGVPFAGKDVNNNLAVRANGTWFNGQKTWIISMLVASVATCYDQDTDNPSNCIRSSGIITKQGYDHYHWIRITDTKAWPCDGELHSFYNYSGVVSLATMNMSVDSSMLNASLVRPDHITVDGGSSGDYSIERRVRVDYTPVSGVSECGFVNQVDIDAMAGVVDFNLTGVTYWGLFDHCDNTMRFRIVLPPDPTGMTPEELDAYGIEKIVSKTPFEYSTDENGTRMYTYVQYRLKTLKAEVT